VRRLSDGFLGVFDFGAEHFRRESCRVDDDEVALIPSRVVTNIVFQKTLHKCHLILPQLECLEGPLPVLPGVVVFGVARENDFHEAHFLRSIV